MADGQILLARRYPQSTLLPTTHFGNRCVKQPQRQQQQQHGQPRGGGACGGGGRVRTAAGCDQQYNWRHLRHFHHEQQQQKQQQQQLQQQQQRRSGGGTSSSRVLGFQRTMASAAGNESAAAPDSYRRFQSYSVPSENWRGKKHGSLYHQNHQNGGGGEIPHVNGTAGKNNNNNIPRDVAEDCESKAKKLEASAVSLRPKRIILVRHGQSEGNVDESAYSKIPDSKISLTDEGWKQAIQCGKRIREIIEEDEVDDWKVYFYVSPYRRTLQTLRGIGLAFERERIAGVREEPRIREQDFGNFQDREKMQVEKEVRLRYGRFFYRFPNGESAADVYDRITGFRETLRADVDVGRFQRPEARSKNMNLVMVSHGLTLRVFLMRWYKWTVQQFEGLWNFGNTGMMVMELGPGGRYSLTMHHSNSDLKAFGMTDDMIADQEWQKFAKPGELNYDWLTSGSSFFTHFSDSENGCNKCEEIPPDIKRTVSGAESELKPEPPTVE